MALVFRTRAANEDLYGIAYQIGIDSGQPLVADRIIDELLDCCEEIARLAPTSRVGTSADSLAPGLRLFSYKRWVIMFRYQDTGILILRIADGSQDYWSWPW